MKKFISVIPFAFLLFRFEIKAVSQPAQMILVLIIALAYLLYNNKYWTKYNRFAKIIKGLSIFILFLAISFICILVHGTKDTSYIIQIIKYIYNMPFWVAFIVHVLKLARKNNASVKEVFVTEFCDVMVLYIAFTLICIAAPSFRTWWISFIHIEELEMSLSQQSRYVARIGWSGFAGFGVTFRCCLGIVFCLDLLNSKNALDYINKRQLYFYIAFLFLGNIFYGRIGMIASGIIIVYIAIIQVFRKGKLGLIGIIILGAGLFAVSVNLLKDSSEVIGNMYRWSFEPILNYLNGKGFSSGSTNTLFRMYRIGKPTLQSFLFGDGYYLEQNGAYYKHVDPGILRFIFLWGIIPTVLAYIMLINVIRTSIFNEKRTFIMLLIVLALFEFKGEICMPAMYIFCPIAILSDKNIAVRRRYVFRKI